MKKISLLMLSLVLVLSLCACSQEKPAGSSTDRPFKTVMVTDAGGISDQSFNQSAWEGLQELGQRTSAQVSYVEPKNVSEYYSVLDKLSDEDYNLIWGIGYAFSDAIESTAQKNPDQQYAIVDYSYGEDTLSNVTGVVFRAQESAFLVGYAAGRTTKTNKVGFIGGIKGDIISQFEYGYKAGVDYAAKELNKKIEVESQYAESFTDSAKGRAIANRMFNNKCDIVFHAAGGVGYGVFEEVKNHTGKFVIGVDRDQSYLAPNKTLTSALKHVGKAVKLITEEVMDGQTIGGETRAFGIEEGCVGIPEDNKNMDPRVYEDTMALSKRVKMGIIELENGKIEIPYNLSMYKDFVQKIK